MSERPSARASFVRVGGGLSLGLLLGLLGGWLTGLLRTPADTSAR